MANATGMLYVITAPSGAGKTSLVNALIKAYTDLHVSVSHTTRPKRPSEKEGVHYHFISEQAFERSIAAGEFLEYANVFGYYYGTSKRWIDETLAAGQDVILEIDWQGALQIMNLFNRCVSIFVLPPSLEALKKRLIARQQDAMTVIQTRLHEAVVEMSHYEAFDYLVVNDEFNQALNDLSSIVNAQRLKCGLQATKLQPLLSKLLN